MCDSCEALMINGVHCHETGCPDAHKGEFKRCAWCGSKFAPEYDENQEYCCESCWEAEN